MMFIIAIIGKKESGKSTFASFLQEEFEEYIPERLTVRHSFGLPLKKMIEEAEICKHEELFGEKTEYSRFMLQTIGTEIVRRVDPDYWCKKMWECLRDTYRHEPDSIVIVDDVRFENEMKLLQSLNAEFVHITRSINDLRQSRHASEVNQEAFLKDMRCWEIENNASIEVLKAAAVAFGRCDQHCFGFSVPTITLTEAIEIIPASMRAVETFSPRWPA